MVVDYLIISYKSIFSKYKFFTAEAYDNYKYNSILLYQFRHPFIQISDVCILTMTIETNTHAVSKIVFNGKTQIICLQICQYKISKIVERLCE